MTGGVSTDRHVEEVVQLVDGALHVGLHRVGKRPGRVDRQGATTCTALAVAATAVATAKHRQLFDRRVAVVGGGFPVGRRRRRTQLVQRVDEMASRPVRAEPDAVVGAAHVGLVFGVPVHGAKFVGAVRKLALFAVLALAVLLVGPAHLGLVARTRRLLLLLLIAAGMAAAGQLVAVTVGGGGR